MVFKPIQVNTSPREKEVLKLKLESEILSSLLNLKSNNFVILEKEPGFVISLINLNDEQIKLDLIYYIFQLSFFKENHHVLIKPEVLRFLISIGGEGQNECCEYALEAINQLTKYSENHQDLLACGIVDVLYKNETKDMPSLAQGTNYAILRCLYNQNKAYFETSFPKIDWRFLN